MQPPGQVPHLRGTVLELPSVIENKELLWADKMDVGDRCTYMPGNMFREVPPADAYMVKRVIHDWNDTECLQILSTMHRAAPQQGRVLIIEQVVPGLDTPHFSKLFDIHMLIMSTGRERTLTVLGFLILFALGKEIGWVVTVLLGIATNLITTLGINIVTRIKRRIGRSS